MSLNPEIPQTMDMEAGHLSTNDVQIIYKLGSLEALVTNSMRRIDDQITALRREATDNHTNLRTEQAEMKVRITKLEEWKTASVAKVTLIIGLVAAVATFLAPTIRHLFGMA